LALTAALYKDGYEAYKGATHIPDYAFCQVDLAGGHCAGGLAFGTGNVVLDRPLPQLKSIGKYAFHAFKGKVQLTGNYPLLVEVGAGAFQSVSDTASKVALVNLANLESIGDYAFNSFKGTVELIGKFPKLSTLGRSVVLNATNINSHVWIVKLSKTAKGNSTTFQSFAGSLALTPSLYKLGWDVYQYATYIPDYAFCQQDFGDALCAGGVAFEGDVVLSGLQQLKSIGKGAFLVFKGKVQLTGSFPKLVEVGRQAFFLSTQHASVVDLIDLPLLNSIGYGAFQSFGGKVQLTGSFPMLVTVGAKAFQHASNTASVVELTELPEQSKGDTTTFMSFAGRLALTPSLYKLGRDVYQYATYIPDYAFCQVAFHGKACEVGLAFDGDVVLTGLPLLKTIGNHAFRSFNGRVHITGSYPELVTVGEGAFKAVSNPASEVVLTDILQLKSIGIQAFYYFAGRVQLTGSFPALVTVGAGAFQHASNADSVVAFVSLGMLKTIGVYAFNEFKGKVTLTGRFPALIDIGEHATFKDASHSGSVVSIECRGKSWVEDNRTRYDGFSGEHTFISGEKRQCVGDE